MIQSALRVSILIAATIATFLFGGTLSPHTRKIRPLFRTFSPAGNSRLTSKKGESPNFESFGKDHVHEYLAACASANYVPRLVWVFWFGTEGLTTNRARALTVMENILGLPVILVGDLNIQSFLKWPVHPDVPYLSGNHKSDYYRIYFMYHYGGYG
jgi:hypothetical protein